MFRLSQVTKNQNRKPLFEPVRKLSPKQAASSAKLIWVGSHPRGPLETPTY